MSEELNHEQIDVKLNEMSIKEEEKSSTTEEQKVEEEKVTDAEASPEQNEEDEEEDKKKLPAFIPRKGKFYEHDDRLGEEQENANGSAIETIEKSKPMPTRNRGPDSDRWKHDRFNRDEQNPKSTRDIIRIYGYDIRKENKKLDIVEDHEKEIQKKQTKNNQKLDDNNANNSNNIKNYDEYYILKNNQKQKSSNPNNNKLNQQKITLQNQEQKPQQQQIIQNNQQEQPKRYSSIRNQRNSNYNNELNNKQTDIQQQQQNKDLNNKSQLNYSSSSTNNNNNYQQNSSKQQINNKNNNIHIQPPQYINQTYYEPANNWQMTPQSGRPIVGGTQVQIQTHPHHIAYNQSLQHQIQHQIIASPTTTQQIAPPGISSPQLVQPQYYYLPADYTNQYAPHTQQTSSQIFYAPPSQQQQHQQPRPNNPQAQQRLSKAIPIVKPESVKVFEKKN